MFADHPDWLLRRGDGFLRCLHDEAWSADGWVYSLDPTHPDVVTHLESIFNTTVGWGFTYQKLDFLYAVALRATAHDPRVTRAERNRAGLDAIRRGVGPAAFLLGCGCPLGPAVGVVDGMRIGPDTAPWWGPRDGSDVAGVEPVAPGLESTVPAAVNALRNTLSRTWMHRRLWLNDPDCLMARTTQTLLAPAESAALAHAIAISGGMTVLSDEIELLDPAARARVRETIEVARIVDAAVSDGEHHRVDLLGSAMPRHCEVDTDSGGFELVVGDDQPVTIPLELEAEPIGTVLGSAAPHTTVGTKGAVDLPVHGSALDFTRRDPTRGAPRGAM